MTSRSDFGDPRLPDRFWSKCIPEPNFGCWLWFASSDNGYGNIGHLVLKIGRVWHDPELPAPFTGDLPASREWAGGGRVTSSLWIGDGMP